ncbi:von Willebrand factor A domain-containing protein c12.2 isoform X2 [Oratosquilla oratoria]|uniref:von Willebrand factor A domain-containing protein c12.2 isoform X1 n=1 Tax=Oratosquilla oratoria TaxID=337810 RepID=UPI003F76AD0C
MKEMHCPVTIGRLQVLRRILAKQPQICFNNASYTYIPFRLSSGASKVTIGGVTKELKKPKNQELVPIKYLNKDLPQSWLHHMRWLIQKDQLGQDVFLIGPPGPLRRDLALAYLQLTQREAEVITLTRDTTDTDLKQRREIRGGTSYYHDQSAVRAAVEGRVLILEGVEKAERNVLPVLNNLLENREMQLEDGRLLIPAQRYDRLLQEHSQEELDLWQMVRVSEDFRVIALGLPSPPYQGHPLDPPLRSRFQAREISHLPFKEHLEQLMYTHKGVPSDVVSKILSLAHTLLSQESKALGLPDFPIDNLEAVMRLLENFPSLRPERALQRLYPFKSFLPAEGQRSVADVFSTFDIAIPQSSVVVPGTNEVRGVRPAVDATGEAEVILTVEKEETLTKVVAGNSWGVSPPPYVLTPYHQELLSELLQSHTVGDPCVIGPRGCGKSAAVYKMAHLLGYQVEPILLYQDMTSRDLVQQRVTSAEGDTKWQFAPLVVSALEGKLAILDGIHRLHHGTLAVLQRLLHNRELQLYDGSRLLRHDRYDAIKEEYNLTDEKLAQQGVYRIHPNFRIVALAEPPTVGSAQGQWLTPEALTLFLYHEMRPLSQKETLDLINKLVGDSGPALEQLISLTERLAKSNDPALRSLGQSLSLRQIVRIARRFQAYPSFDLHTAIYKACLARFLPPLAKQALDKSLETADITKPEPLGATQLACTTEDGVLRIGNTHAQIYQPSTQTKVPDTLFFDIQQHVAVLESMLQDWLLGDHLLLVGNQGVGKNKLADRFLNLLNRPREYIQLHRDTTVQSLTLQPTVKEGRIQHEDSPLVKAVRDGHVLVVDEADKAPVHVTCVLKTLVESGEMLLSDGRRIMPPGHVPASSSAGKILVSHPDFRMIVLANRPGFPFLGNDFFGALGDLFSCHAIDNPSIESEMTLLRSYGPDVAEDVMRRLVGAFGDLRAMADQGLIQYPYSTREVVNIVKHLQEFPNEGIVSVVRNVFDFDSWSSETKETVVRVMHRHGIPVGASPTNINLSQKVTLAEPAMTAMWQIVRQRKAGKTQLMHLPTETSTLKYKGPIYFNVFRHAMDMTEARAAVFTEQQRYWTLPMHETALVTDVAVSRGGTLDPLDDTLYVVTAAPVALYTMCPRGDFIGQILLHDVFSMHRGSYQPRPRLTALGGQFEGSVAVHEEITNTLLLVTPDTGSVRKVQLASLLESAADSIVRKFSSSAKEAPFFRMCRDGADRGVLALWEVGGGRVLVVDLVEEKLHSITLPVILTSLHLLDKCQWLVVDKDNKKWLVRGLEDDPIPSVLHPVTETPEDKYQPVRDITRVSRKLPDFVLSSALRQRISAPSRLVTSIDSLAHIVVGFPDLDSSGNEVYTWPRDGPSPDNASKTVDVSTTTVLLPEVGQVVRVVETPPPRALQDSQGVVQRPTNVGSYLEVTDIVNHTLSYVPVPRATHSSPYWSWSRSVQAAPLVLAPISGEGVATVDAGGVVRIWQTGSAGLERALNQWRQMIGDDNQNLRLELERTSGLDVSEPKYGKDDPDNQPHVGGNTWAGGTGGRDTAGLGGKGGPYRLDKGHDVHQLPQWEKDAVPEEVKKAAHEMAQKAFKERLREIRMSEYDASLYERFSGSVKGQVTALRVILSSLQARSKERQWVRHRTDGELDDTKLIEGLAGERGIYKQRREEEPEMGAPMTKPKRLRLVVDVSGSMYRFNGYDGRLERELEAVLMVMEAFEGFETKFKYDIYGHSGEEEAVEIVQHASPPTNNKERLEVLKTMQAHSQFCLSGDNTIEAARHAVTAMTKEDADETFVILLSDANLERYGIKPRELTNVLSAQPSVNTYAIFIGSLGDQADRLTQALPTGRAFVCLDLKKLPQILQQIFMSAMLK